ncbi:MAG: DUF616 domain-containing protein [Lachnospiraceae bacterium]|nr:DUF616 domain-containing protein [Lachnospiraceae bacterium]
MDIIDEILNNKKVYIYGASEQGKNICVFLRNNFKINTIGFIDQKSALNNKEIMKGIFCKNSTCLENNLCYPIIVSLSAKNRIQMDELFEKNGVKKYIFWYQLINETKFKEKWIGCRINSKDLSVKKNIAIYTCISGNYDDLKYPEIIEESCEYYVISDKRPDNIGQLKWINIDTIVPNSDMSNKEKNRYCKMTGHKIFNDYEYSIYIDGNVTIKQEISSFVRNIGSVGLALYRHETRNCIYEEGITVEMMGLTDIDILREQLMNYANDGMPEAYGLFAGGVIVRDNHNVDADRITEAWWNEHHKWNTRDQISLMYVLWKNGINLEKIGVLYEGGSRLEDPHIEWAKHK